MKIGKLSKSGYKDIANQLISLGMSKEHVAALNDDIKLLAAANFLVAKAPKFFAHSQLTANEFLKITGEAPKDFEAFKQGFLNEREIYIKAAFDKFEVSEYLQNEFNKRIKVAESKLDLVRLDPELLFFSKIALSINTLIGEGGVIFKHLAAVTKQYNLSPKELKLYISDFHKLNLSIKDFIEVVREVDEQMFTKLGPLEKHPIFPHLKSVDDFKSALKADVGVLNKCTNVFEFFADQRIPKGAMESYGVSKIIDVISKYNFDDVQLKDFTFKIAREKGKLATTHDDLDRLAKIILNPGLNSEWKQKFADARHSPQEWLKLEEDLKVSEGYGISKWWYSEPYAEVEKIWHPVLVSANLDDNNI